MSSPVRKRSSRVVNVKREPDFDDSLLEGDVECEIFNISEIKSEIQVEPSDFNTETYNSDLDHSLQQSTAPEKDEDEEEFAESDDESSSSSISRGNKTFKYKCDQCFSKFQTKSGRDNHKQKKHSESSEKPQKVRKSGKYQFNYEVEDDYEKIEEDGVKMFRCKHCHIQKNRRNNMKEHILTHKPHLKPFQCEIPDCKMRFISISSFKKHAIEHEMGIRGQFKCRNCDRIFKLAEGLKKHDCCPQIEAHLKSGSNNKTEPAKKRKVYEYNFLVNDDYEKLFRDDKPYYRCKICGIEKKRLGNVKEHILRHKPELKPYKCASCQKGFISKSSYRLHLQTHELSKDSFDMQEVIDKFGDEPGTQKTVKQEKFEDPLMIIETKFAQEFSDEEIGEDPVESSSESAKSPAGSEDSSSESDKNSDSSPESSSDSDDYEKRKKSKKSSSKSKNSRSKSWKSPKSKKSAANKSKKPEDPAKKSRPTKYDFNDQLANDYERFMNSRGEFWYRCKICRLEKYRINRIKEHLLIHKPHLKPFGCPLCEKRFISKSIFRAHWAVHESGGIVKHVERVPRYAGETSGKSGKSPVKTVKSEDSSSNPVVMKFKRVESASSKMERRKINQLLEDDVEAYTNIRGEKWYRCRICCKFDYFRKSNVKEHIYSHKPELKPFKCPEADCDRRFVTSALLNKHLEVHERNKSFQCSTCLEEFVNRNQLLNHRREHYMEMNPFTCDICNIRAATLEAIKTHMKEIHAERKRKKK